jgi:predicted ester cyclase
MVPEDPPMPALSPAALMRAWFEEVWNRGDDAAIDAYLAPDGVIHAVDEAGADAVGPEAFRAFHRRFLAAFSDIRMTLHEVIEQGDLAAARFTAELTHSGEGLGVPPSGQRLTLRGMAMLRARDGKAVEGWNEWDRMGLAMACRLVAPAG